MRILSLLIPGLFDVQPALTAPAPQPPALLTLLARAQRGSAVVGDDDALLLMLFGIAAANAADVPVAAFSRLGEAQARADAGYWLRADPVHLRADQARLLLFGPQVLAVRIEEARALAESFNAAFGAAGWQLETPHPQRWYLRLPDDPGIRTQAPHAVIGRNIDSFLPQGVNGKRWHAVLNEVQMLFHDNPVNAAREQQGQLAINSVWFWGGGALPETKLVPWTQVCSAEPYARGLAIAAGVAVVDAAAIAAVWTKHAAAEQLVVNTELRDAAAYSDADAWRAAVTDLEHDWFAPALAALRGGGLDILRLYPGNGRVYEITRAGLWRFWRRRHSLDYYRSAD